MSCISTLYLQSDIVQIIVTGTVLSNEQQIHMLRTIGKGKFHFNRTNICQKVMKNKRSVYSQPVLFQPYMPLPQALIEKKNFNLSTPPCVWKVQESK